MITDCDDITTPFRPVSIRTSQPVTPAGRRRRQGAQPYSKTTTSVMDRDNTGRHR